MLTLVLLITSTGCSSEVSLNGGGQRFASQADSGARYVFLFIGDGMGLAQVELGRALLAPGDSLSFPSFPVTGMISTSAADRYITDSAAAGTALATGYATSVGTVSMAANHRDTLKTIVEMAEGDGRRTGVVSSVGIDNATPACFYAHEPLRGSLYAIALQMASSGVDYFGGGRPEGNFPHKRSRAVVDRGDIDSLMQLSGYSVVKNSASLRAVMPGTPCIASGPSDMFGALPFDMDRPARDADLALFAREGIRLLDNSKGFFMMVEGGKIDWACHANDAAAAGRDVAAFDRAIREAVAFYHRHPEETLIVVTADHECGGLSLGNRDGAYDSRLELLHYQTISMEKLSGKVAAWKKAGGVSFLAALDSVRVFAGLGPVLIRSFSSPVTKSGNCGMHSGDHVGWRGPGWSVRRRRQFFAGSCWHSQSSGRGRLDQQCAYRSSCSCIRAWSQCPYVCRVLPEYGSRKKAYAASGLPGSLR